MSSSSSSRTAPTPCRPRYATPRNPARKTLGPRVGAISERLGEPFMPWQQQVADVAGEIDPATGTYWYRTVVIVVPRQSGKTTLLKGEQAHRCVTWPRQRVTYTAQTRNAARKKWEDEFVESLESSPLRTLFTTRKANGQEAMRFRNRSMWGIEATTESSGHGDVLDLGVIDEAFKQVDARLEQAMRPAMMTRKNAQLWIISTAGTADSTFLWDKVEAGRAIVELGDPDARFAYFEWSAEDGLDPGDVETWRTCMPALGITVDEATVRADFESMPLREFERAYLNRWSSSRVDPVFADEDWNHPAVLDPDAMPGDELTWSLDVTPDRARASIALSDGRHIEVADCTGWEHEWLDGTAETHRGTEWAVRRMAELVHTHGGDVVIDPAGPAAAFATELEGTTSVRVGDKLEPVKITVRQPSMRDYANACGNLYDAVVAHDVVHIGQNELNSAVAAATKRRRGDVWTWARNDTTADLSPLVACTLARWGAATPRETKPKRPVFAW